MKTTEQRLQEERAKLAQKEQEIIREGAILDKLAPFIEGYNEPMVHFSKLYGTRGAVHFQNNDYRLSTDNSKDPDAHLLGELLTAFQPVPVVRIKDGCTSFRPDIEANTAGRKEEQIYECFGVTIKIETFQHQTAAFEWASELDGELWRFSVRFPLYKTDLGRLEMRARYYGNSDKVASWETCQFYPKLELDAQVIRWDSGGPEYPNSFTLYWDRDSGAALDFSKLAQKETQGQG